MRVISSCISITIFFRHGGEEGVTCNVIAFDSKSDQGKHKLLTTTYNMILVSGMGNRNSGDHIGGCKESQEVDQSGAYIEDLMEILA